MSRLSQHRVLIAGVLSPPAAVLAYLIVYNVLTGISTNHEKDWLFRLSLSSAAMLIPAAVTSFLAIKDGRRNGLGMWSKVGVAIAILSLALIWKPVSDGITRWKQSRNLALSGVDAPGFETPDLTGNIQRLKDHRGEVVLVNIWATWCAPCRSEMPKLDQLYRKRKDDGFVVFGISDEETGVQQKFLNRVQVSYPLLTLNGNVPNLYKDIARYPAIFLIDRQGHLQPAPSPEEPFERVEEAVNRLLAGGAPARQE